MLGSTVYPILDLLYRKQQQNTTSLNPHLAPKCDLLIFFTNYPLVVLYYSQYVCGVCLYSFGQLLRCCEIEVEAT